MVLISPFLAHFLTAKAWQRRERMDQEIQQPEEKKKKKSGYEYQKRRNSKVLLNGTRHLFTFCISPKRSNETPWQFFPFCLSEVVLNLLKNKCLPCEFQIQGFTSKNCISKLLGVIEEILLIQMTLTLPLGSDPFMKIKRFLSVWKVNE